MRQLTALVIIVFISILGLAFNSQAADIKVGVIDFQEVVGKSEPGQKIEAGLKKEGERLEAELTKDKETLKGLQEKLEREAMVMSREAREEKEIEFRVKARNLQEKEGRYRSEFVGKQRQEIDQLRKVVLEIAQEIGKKEGFTMVVSKVGVLYFDPSIDLTDKVVQELNKRLANKGSQ
ncbi:MAG: OmpH family outer membrane protein [Desulfobacterales bacterium]